MKSLRLPFIKCFTAIALSGYLLLLIMGGTPSPNDISANKSNLCGLVAFTMNSHHQIFQPEVIQQYNDSFKMWQGRWAAVYLASFYWDALYPVMYAHRMISFDGYPAHTYGAVIAGWYILWFLAYCAIVSRLESWPLLMFGGFAGIVSNLAATTTSIFLPWDVCSMFFWAWGLIAFERGKFKQIFLIAALGSCFKETTLLLLVPPLMSKVNQKWFYAGAVVVFFIICRALSTHLLIGNLQESGNPLWQKNIHYLFTSTANHPLFLDAGLVVTIWFTPVDRRWKYTCAAFLAGMFFMGGFNEYRQYLDILPIGLYGLDQAARNSSKTPIKAVKPSQ